MHHLTLPCPFVHTEDRAGTMVGKARRRAVTSERKPRLNLRLTPEIDAKIREIAQAEGRSRANVGMRALLRALDPWLRDIRERGRP